MNLVIGPELCTEALCIAGNPTIGAVISSFFNEPTEYFCLLEPPRMSRPDYSNEVVRRNNVVARLQPNRIILAALEKKTLLAFQKYFSPKITIIIDSIGQVENKLSEIKTIYFQGAITCNLKEMAHGLLLAKRLKMRLTVDCSAPSLDKEFRQFLPIFGHQIVVEDSDDFAPIIAANYAFSLNADLKLLPGVTRRDVDKVYDELLDRRVFRTSSRGTRAETSLRERSAKYQVQVSTTGPDFITFVTHGIPYGYFFPGIPSTHLFSYPDLGLNIFAGIYYSSRVKATRSAVVIDPGYFQNSECNFIKQDLQAKGILVKSLEGDQAGVYNVRNHIQYYPYDLLYICAHAGEMKGQRLKIRFEDRRGQYHVIVIDHAAGLGPTGEGSGGDAKVEVLDFSRFVELDGIDWDDEKGKKSIAVSEIMQDFTKIPPLQWEVIENIDIPYVKDCVALQLTDHFCLALFHVVADHEYPIVFNNACVSFFNFSGVFLFAGARAYIGTLTPVNNTIAKTIAQEVFKNLTNEKPLAVLLWEVQRRMCPDPQDRSYIHVGCHFTNILRPDKDVTFDLKSRLSIALERWTKKPKVELADEGVKHNRNVVIEFLTAQIMNDGS